MTRTFYRQCRLTRRLTSGVSSETVSFIPEKFAKVGTVVRLREDVGGERRWADGWEVASVGSDRVEESALPDPHSRASSHRRATGDAATR